MNRQQFYSKQSIFFYFFLFVYVLRFVVYDFVCVLGLVLCRQRHAVSAGGCLLLRRLFWPKPRFKLSETQSLLVEVCVPVSKRKEFVTLKRSNAAKIERFQCTSIIRYFLRTSILTRSQNLTKKYLLFLYLIFVLVIFITN